MPKHAMWPAVAALLALFTIAPVAETQPNEFKHWPAGKSPKEIGKRVAEHFVGTPHTNFGRPMPTTFITYPEDVAWYGALTFARLSGDTKLAAQPVDVD